MNVWTPGDQILLWSVNVAVQVGLIAGVSLLVSRGLRQSAAARYSLLCTALILVLLCPTFTAIMQSSGRGLVSLPAAAGQETSNIDVVSIKRDEANNRTVQRSIEVFQSATDDGPQPAAPDVSGPVPTNHTEFVAVGETRSNQTPSAVMPAGVAPRSWPVVLRFVLTAGLTIWACGAALLLLKLFRSWWQLRRLLADAQPNHNEELAKLFQQTWNAMEGCDRRTVPELVFSDRVTGPVAAGLATPKVILPNTVADTLDSHELKTVLIHELAHIVRSDQQIVLLQNLTQAIFWLHPVIRLLNRRLAKSREEVCDNYVLSTTSAASYSRTLLTLAELLQTPRPMPGTVGLLTSRWKLEDRVSGLLDGTRNCVTKLSRSTFVAITLACLAITVAITMGTASFATLPDVQETRLKPTDSKSDEVVLVKGVVLRPDGSPAPGATVRAAASLYVSLKWMLDEGFKTPVEQTITDDQGRFAIVVHKRPFGDLELEGTRFEDSWKDAVIATSVDQYGCVWTRFKDVENVEDVKLQLIEDRVIRGRAIDLEGQPLAGLAVQIGGITAAVDDDPQPWLESVRAGEPPTTVHRHLDTTTAANLAGLPARIITDADGTFEIQNTGVNRLVQIELAGEGVVTTESMVVNRDMEPLSQKMIASSTRKVTGRDFTITMAPGRDVTGIVVDAKTRQPLPGVSVEVDRLAGSMLAGRKLTPTTTDAQGRFTLHGLPKAQLEKANRWERYNGLLLRPADDQPYLMQAVEIPEQSGLDAIDLTIKLNRGIWITGRVTDKQTGAPVRGAWLHYLPYRSNKFAQALPEFDEHGNVDGDQTRYKTNERGEFRLVGLPGPAVVGVISTEWPFRFGVGYDQIDPVRINKKNKHLLTYRNPVTPSAKWPNAILAIDPEEGTTSVELDFQLDPGDSVDVRFVDADGHIVTGASTRGLASRSRGGRSTENRTYQVACLGPGEERVVIAQHKERKIGGVKRVQASSEHDHVVEIQLEPLVTVTGVLTDNGIPLSGITIRPDVQPSGDFSNSLSRWVTDAAGRFTGTLIPGCNYRLLAMASDIEIVANIGGTLEIQPGQHIDFGTLRLNEDRKFVGEEPLVVQGTSDEQR